jgi:hypothetical protein
MIEAVNYSSAVTSGGASRWPPQPATAASSLHRRFFDVCCTPQLKKTRRVRLLAFLIRIMMKRMIKDATLKALGYDS